MSSIFQGKREGGNEGGGMTAGRNGTVTVIAHGVRVEGDFSSQGDVLIEGDVTGKVAVAGMLTVGPQASLEADISAEQASIAGSIKGHLTIRSHVDIKATAKLMGDLTCATASIESGAMLDGRTSIGAASQAPSKPARSSDKKTVEEEMSV